SQVLVGAEREVRRTPLVATLLDGGEDRPGLQAGEEVNAPPAALQGVGIRQALVKRLGSLRGGGVATDQNRKLAPYEPSCREEGYPIIPPRGARIPSAGPLGVGDGESASGCARTLGGSGQGRHQAVTTWIPRSGG